MTFPRLSKPAHVHAGFLRAGVRANEAQGVARFDGDCRSLPEQIS